jgi:hypothetical protein
MGGFAKDPTTGDLNPVSIPARESASLASKGFSTFMSFSGAMWSPVGGVLDGLGFVDSEESRQLPRPSRVQLRCGLVVSHSVAPDHAPRRCPYSLLVSSNSNFKDHFRHTTITPGGTKPKLEEICGSAHPRTIAQWAQLKGNVR